MVDSNFEIDYAETGESGDLKRVLTRYVKYWPWFLGCIVLCISLAYLYMRYAPIVYESVAKIEVIDDSQGIDISADALSLLGQGTSINMDNEVEVLRSYRILKQVVEALNLDVSYYEVGRIKTREIWNPPFAITKLYDEDSLNLEQHFDLAFDGDQVSITNDKGVARSISLTSAEPGASGYPFDLALRPEASLNEIAGINYRVVLTPVKQAVLNLAEKIRIQPVSKNSEILALSLQGESVQRSESILNELINKFNQDGISDRQLISKRTLDFIDERFLSLSEELDSIEGGKEAFKRVNNLSYIESDADYSLQQRALAQDEVTRLETQVSMADLLKKALTDQSSYSLLPVDVGLENSGLNTLVSEYNRMALEREKLTANAGESHPSLVNLNTQLQNSRVNILKSLNIYQTQLKLSLRQLDRERSRANSTFSQLPEKEMMLRAIERQQSIKENLFILLLEKREEAALSYAVTAPSVKVVDYALTDNEPLSPKMRIVYPMSLMLGMVVPFLILYLRFSLNGKVQDRAELAAISPQVPIAGEIPTFKKSRAVIHAGDRSIMAESFRMLCTNLEYLFPNKSGEEGTCLMVTSSVKGEGKTSVALNLALAYAGLDQKVLLVGADLRSQGIMRYFKPNSFSYGLADYLAGEKVAWKDCIASGFEAGENLSICFSGKQPPNPSQLLAGRRFAGFLEKALAEYDKVVLDTAPCMSVADTLLISRHANVCLFVVRAGTTDKGQVRYSRELSQNSQLANMAYLLNDVGSLKSRQYHG